ncbi:Mov34/MPN/PAD-1 family protein [Luteimonas fraxinea]|uniref:Mov34/MPN/PAD-1 family protein n=1 Tax=Luteimonas fraxinea TaxID=2901869 RepID=UPI001E305704|nr:Mov34/MPN/PAD-1 family protein [Luteimonas fraxinea]MCD9126015.1 Mov34/MPN/PAD-1 family protein [Luteimonas fraxinea]
MAIEFFKWGERVDAVPPELSEPQLLELVRACERHPHFKLVELRVVSTPSPHVVIIVEASDGTIAPQNAAGVRVKERLALSFRPGAQSVADVRALRRDFPLLSHLNGVQANEPASLCLYEDWSFEERRWTPSHHLERILWWLRHNADGTLHQQDQALEPVFYNTGYVLVLPSELADQPVDSLGAVSIEVVENEGDYVYLIASMQTQPNQKLAVQMVVLDLEPISDRPIQSAPSTLGELEKQLEAMGSSLRPLLVEAIKRLVRGDAPGLVRNGRVLLLLRMPRAREGSVERYDLRGFYVAESLEALGMKLGALFRTTPDQPAHPFEEIGGTESKTSLEENWRDVQALLVDPRVLPACEDARRMSGVPEDGASFQGTLAGVGALGSALADIWTREGWGQWTFVDPDQIAPHNLVRHRASRADVGRTKARATELQVMRAMGSAKSCGSICAKANDFDRGDVRDALSSAALLVDATTTVAVPRDWSERELPRSCSAFFTFSGLSAVLLFEDAARSQRLADLEAQYYRAVLNAPWGETHLDTSERVRIGNGCRDHSLVLPYELALLHAAQIARRVRKAAEGDGALISVWELDDASGGISAHSVAVRAVRRSELGEWSVRWDEGIEEKIRLMRSANLPRETGGILVGVVDHKLRTIHVVDASDAPSDSVGDETSFIRGTDGGHAYVERCSRLTRGMVSYVGEWHSHPDGYAADPSATDIELLATLTARLHADGIPALMMIVADDQCRVLLGDAAAKR